MSTQGSAVLSMATDAAQNELKQQLEKTRASLNGAYDDISNVSNQLKQRPALAPLLVSWEELSSVFRGLQWNSRDNATEQATSLEQLSDAILPIIVGGGVPPEDLIAVIQQFMEGTFSARDVAQDLPNRFSQVQQSAADFSPRLQQFARDQHWKAEDLRTQVKILTEQKKVIESAITESGTRIFMLRESILALEQEIEELRKSGDPDAERKIKELEIQVAAKQKEVSDLEAEISSLQPDLKRIERELSARNEELQNAEANESAAQKAEAQVEPVAKNAIPQVVQQINVLSQVWAGLNNDADSIIRYIKNPSDVPVVIAVYQKEGSVYNIIRRALRDFAVNVGRN